MCNMLMTERVFLLHNVPRHRAAALPPAFQQLVKASPESSLRAGRRLMFSLRAAGRETPSLLSLRGQKQQEDLNWTVAHKNDQLICFLGFI